MLDPAAFHDLLALVHVLLLPLFDDLPELIRQDVHSLVQLILRRLILPEVGELVTEVIEILDELIKLLLLCVRSVDKLQVLSLSVSQRGRDSFPLDPHLSEDLFHLALVVSA